MLHAVLPEEIQIQPLLVGVKLLVRLCVILPSIFFVMETYIAMFLTLFCSSDIFFINSSNSNDWP